MEPPSTPPLQPFRGYHSFRQPFRGGRFRQQTTNASAEDSMATGPVLLSAAADMASTSISKTHLPRPKTDLFTDSRYAMASANNVCR